MLLLHNYRPQHQLTDISITHKCFTVVVSAETKSPWVYGWSHLLSAGMLGRSQTISLHDHKGLLMSSKHILHTHALHYTPHIHRLVAVFEMINPKLIQEVFIFRQITPYRCISIERTLGVSESNSLQGLQLKVMCRNVKPEPPNHASRRHIYVS